MLRRLLQNHAAVSADTPSPAVTNFSSSILRQSGSTLATAGYRCRLFSSGKRTNSLPPLISSSPVLPSSLLEIGALNTARGSVGALQAHTVRSGAKRQPTNDLLCILESKSAALVAAVFVDFRRNNCIMFGTKTSQISYTAYTIWVQFLRGRRRMRSFFYPVGSRHHYPMKVDAYAAGNISLSSS